MCGEQPGLAAYHTIWMREHNRLAEMLGTLRPGAGDEEIFQEARSIVIATHWNSHALGVPPSVAVRICLFAVKACVVLHIAGMRMQAFSVLQSS